MSQDDEGDALEYLFSGAVGDSFVAMCKLAAGSPTPPRRLRRMCLHAGPDPTITRVAALFPQVTYEPDFIRFETIAEMREFAFANRNRYLNIFADGNGRGNEPDDPPGFTIEPFPELELSDGGAADLPSPVLGIHLHSGTPASGLRVLAAQSVAALCEALSDSSVRVVLFGTGDPVTDAELDHLDDLGAHVTNMIGRDTFGEWVRMLTEVDLLITPEGFPAFLAMSQRVPTLALFTRADAVLRMPPEWRARSVCVRPHLSGDSHAPRWELPEPVALGRTMLARFDPDALDRWECSA